MQFFDDTNMLTETVKEDHESKIGCINDLVLKSIDLLDEETLTEGIKKLETVDREEIVKSFFVHHLALNKLGIFNSADDDATREAAKYSVSVSPEEMEEAAKQLRNSQIVWKTELMKKYQKQFSARAIEVTDEVAVDFERNTDRSNTNSSFAKGLPVKFNIYIGWIHVLSWARSLGLTQNYYVSFRALDKKIGEIVDDLSADLIEIYNKTCGSNEILKKYFTPFITIEKGMIYIYVTGLSSFVCSNSKYLR